MNKREKRGTAIKRGNNFFARVRYIDEFGKEKTIERKAENKSHARRICKELLDDLEKHGEKYLQAERLTFAELADYYDKHFIIEAQYSNGRKITGLRSWKSAKQFLTTLKKHFGKRLVRGITYGDLKTFRSIRLNFPTRGDKALAEKTKTAIVSTRSVASVNREMALLRKMFNVAVAEKWIAGNPFDGGESLISTAAETKRERIITRTEEMALLAACEIRDKWNRKSYLHLKPILIAALDTGARQGELLSLTWRDVDFNNNVLTLRTYKDKNVKERQIAFTIRLGEILTELLENSDKNADTLVFGIKSNVKRSFETVRKKAGLDGLRFHDLRHTAATRLVEKHIPLAEVGRVLGHSQIETTYRYANSNIETARRAAEALNSFHIQETQKSETDANEFIN
jgi:integrase